MQITKTLGAIAICAAATLSASTASAAPCTTQGATTAVELIYDVTKPLIAKGIGVSLLLGLEPGTQPAASIAKITAPCTRGTIVVGKKTFTIYGENTGVPVRWATSPAAPGAIAYLASMPRPDMALTWSNQFSRDKTTPPVFDASQTMFAVVYAKGDLRFVMNYFTTIPDDAKLKTVLTNALSGKIKPLRGYNVKTHSVIRGKDQ